MKNSIAVIAALLSGIVYPSALTAQPGTSALPTLSWSVSPQGNGMGGAAAATPSADASATIANPGQLGFNSLHSFLSASTFSPETVLLPTLDWGPTFRPTMTVSALNAGINLTEVLSLPFSAGIGVGYSRTFIDWGTFAITGSSGPEPIGTARIDQTYENYSVGLGLEYVARLGIGMNFKRIRSRFPGIVPGGVPTEVTANPKASDFGILLDVPLLDIATDVTGFSLAIADGVGPYLDVTSCFVKSNVGDGVTYTDPAQIDPLPRTAVLGLGLNAGILARAGNSDWKILSFELVHQAEDVLVTRHNDGTFEYKGGLGDLSIGENVLVGRVTGNVLMRKGWQVGAADFLYLRGGSVMGYGYDYATTGYGICLAGLVRLLEFASPAIAGTSWVAFIGDHIDLQYQSASYMSVMNSGWDGTTFREFNLVIRGFPW